MLFALIFRNAFRHRLRTLLTITGLAIAILAFGLLSTVISAWYAGAEGASGARLITRNSVSLIFPLPINYREKVRQVDGVRRVSQANWFGGVYKEPKNFFPQFAVEAESYLDIYTEYRLTDDERREFLHDRRGCIVGAKLARTYGFKVGDTITLKGRIFPGNWDFVIRGIYTGRDAKTDVSQMLFHWDYLNETLKKQSPRSANSVGVYIAEIAEQGRAAEISRAIDAQFKNSNAETLTETDRAFQLGFVSRTESIVVAIRVVSYLVIFIILAVMANTMAMTVRERTAEYATLKALGFGPAFLILLIYGESLAIAAVGGGIGIAATFPTAALFASTLGKFFPVFDVSNTTLALQALWSLAVGLVSAFFPARRAARVKIVDGLRSIG